MSPGGFTSTWREVLEVLEVLEALEVFGVLELDPLALGLCAGDRLE
jgi:hypothetical protein